MTKGINKRLKKSISLAVTSIMVTLSISTTAFASPVFYTSEEGIGIEVNNSVGDVQTLWATWNNGVTFRANYDHSYKVHRCSATNDHETRMRSEWASPGVRAISPWLSQTLSNNKVWASTEE